MLYMLICLITWFAEDNWSVLLTYLLSTVFSNTAVWIFHILVHGFELRNMNLMSDKNSVAGCHLPKMVNHSNCAAPDYCHLSLLSLSFFLFLSHLKMQKVTQLDSLFSIFFELGCIHSSSFLTKMARRKSIISSITQLLVSVFQS